MDLVSSLFSEIPANIKVHLLSANWVIIIKPLSSHLLPEISIFLCPWPHFPVGFNSSQPVVFSLSWSYPCCFHCLPWGVHRRACLVTLTKGFLRVWPSRCHFLFPTCRRRGCCSALFNKSSFPTLSCHWIGGYRHSGTKVWILLLEALVTHQVSQVYRRTLLTFVLKILSVVFTEVERDPQVDLRIWNAVVAFPILATMSWSVLSRSSSFAC